MKYIITENQKDRIFIIRRLSKLMKLVRGTDVYKNPCHFSHISHYTFMMKKELLDTLSMLDQVKDKDVIWEVIMGFQGNEIMNNYFSRCK